MNDVIAAFQLRGRVKAVLVSREGDDVSTEVAKIQVAPSWGAGDRHGRPERGLLAHGLQKGSLIANFRQVSVIGVAETEAVREVLQLPAPIPHGLLCENLVIDGIDPLTSLPLGTMLLFQKSDGSAKRTAAIVLWGENTPCVTPGEAIQRYFETHFPIPKEGLARLPADFVKAAKGRRGLVAASIARASFTRVTKCLSACPSSVRTCRPRLLPVDALHRRFFVWSVSVSLLTSFSCRPLLPRQGSARQPNGMSGDGWRRDGMGWDGMGWTPAFAGVTVMGGGGRERSAPRHMVRGSTPCGRGCFDPFGLPQGAFLATMRGGGEERQSVRLVQARDTAQFVYKKKTPRGERAGRGG